MSNDDWNDSDDYERMRNTFENQNGGCAPAGNAASYDENEVERGEKLVLAYLSAVDQNKRTQGPDATGSIDEDQNVFVSESDMAEDMKQVQEYAVEHGIIESDIFDFTYSQGDLESRTLYNTLESLHADEIITRTNNAELGNPGVIDQYWGITKDPNSFKIDEEGNEYVVFEKGDYEMAGVDAKALNEMEREVETDEELFRKSLEILEEEKIG
jgi:hypothetical protein